MKNKFAKRIFYVLVVSILIALLPTSQLISAQNSTDNPVIKSLTLYENAVSARELYNDTLLSGAMIDLVKERQTYYKKYFEIGLHSKLIRIESKFEISSLVVTNPGTATIKEELLLTGIPILQTAMEYPVYKAAMLAIEQTKDPALISLLQKYASEILQGVQQSIDEGEFTIAIENLHTLQFENSSGSLLSDDYSSKSNDDSGTDHAYIENGKVIRVEPDLTLLPDYQLYVTPTATMIEEILSKFTMVSETKQQVQQPKITRQYSGSTASAYIRTYVKSTTNNECGTLLNPIWQNKTNWNGAYNQYNCNDCANYVSQALAYGGMATDATWKPYTMAWVNVSNLTTYIIGNSLGYYTTSPLLGLGDLGVIPSSHVVMVSALNPLRYSAHTSDRLNYAWQSSLTHCIDIY